MFPWLNCLNRSLLFSPFPSPDGQHDRVGSPDTVLLFLFFIRLTRLPRLLPVDEPALWFPQGFWYVFVRSCLLLWEARVLPLSWWLVTHCLSDEQLRGSAPSLSCTKYLHVPRKACRPVVFPEEFLPYARLVASRT